jgi:hypothetical protein
MCSSFRVTIRGHEEESTVMNRASDAWSEFTADMEIYAGKGFSHR